MGADRDVVLPLFATALLFGLAGAGLGLVVAGHEESKLCRHAIQRNFGLTRDVAQSLIDAERKEDW